MTTILVVDDHQINRDFLVTLLKHTGHRLLEAENGVQALELVRLEHPELVISDILMPEMDGFQFVMSLRTDPELTQPHVIFLTATYMEWDARVLATACGVMHFMAKPVEPEELLSKVDNILTGPPYDSGTMQPLDNNMVNKYLQLVSGKLYRHVEEQDQLVTQRTQQIADINAALETEVSKRRMAEEALRLTNKQLEDEVVHDPLTGLHNRRYLKNILETEIARCRRREQPLSVMMLDIDHFKLCNDTFGHQAGDAVLCAVGRHLESLIRQEDMLCRYGGEEFVVMAGDISADMALQLAEKLRASIEQLEITHDGKRIDSVTLSIGIAMFPRHGDTDIALLQAADDALYKAKQSGRNRVVMIDDSQAATLRC